MLFRSRQVHTCVRIEAVLAEPTNEECTKLYRRGGVTVLVRCTFCGESTQIMTELKRVDFNTLTGFTINGRPLEKDGRPKPLHGLTLEDLIRADEFVNGNNEKGGHLMVWCTEHACSKNHRCGYIKGGACYDTHVGGLADGGSARHRAKTGRAGLTRARSRH